MSWRIARQPVESVLGDKGLELVGKPLLVRFLEIEDKLRGLAFANQVSKRGSTSSSEFVDRVAPNLLKDGLGNVDVFPGYGFR